jgi:cyclopropane fatty-acyl-phospholipid synthase-like methyltransferase
LLTSLRTRWTNEATFNGILYEFDGTTPEEFFQTGEDQVEALLARADDFWDHRPSISALDFGCGMGRLTRALAERFVWVTGLDISHRMIELAKTYDVRPTYRVMDLNPPALKPVDFLISVFVLQHLPSTLARDYLETFPSWLNNTGLGAVQISTPSDDEGLGDTEARKALGGKLLDVDELQWPGSPEITSRTYWFHA